jgi:excisionase family DNA binding protein
MMQTSYKSYSYKMPPELSAALFFTPAPQRKADSSLSRPSLMTIAEAAKYLGMSTKWLYRNYQNLPHVKIGGGVKPRIRFKGADLDKWIAARTFDWRKQ